MTDERPSDGKSREELATHYDEWASKDGNTPGYNLQKAKNYGAQAAFWKQRAIALGASPDECATCGEFINEGVCKCPRGLESMAGSIKLGWWIDRDPGATFDASELVTKLPVVLDRLEDAITSALSQCVDVYIDGEDNPPVRVMFDIGGHEIEIDDGPINGSLRELREDD